VGWAVVTTLVPHVLEVLKKQVRSIRKKMLPEK